MEQNYKKARANLLMMALLTVLDILLIVGGSTISFPFSAIIPQIMAVTGWSLLGAPVAILCIFFFGATAILIGAYFLCYFMSKKHYGWMIGALCLFSLDTLICLGYIILHFSVAYLIDLAFHGWVLYYLILGVINGRKL